MSARRERSSPACRRHSEAVRHVVDRPASSASLWRCSFAASPGECRTIVDMDGRSVTLPEKISRIVTVGPVPVLNGFLFAFGRQQSIVNGLPRELARKFQFVFAPDLAKRPDRAELGERSRGGGHRRAAARSRADDGPSRDRQARGARAAGDVAEMARAGRRQEVDDVARRYSRRAKHRRGLCPLFRRDARPHRDDARPHRGDRNVRASSM